MRVDVGVGARIVGGVDDCIDGRSPVTGWAAGISKLFCRRAFNRRSCCVAIDGEVPYLSGSR
eukprot:11181455-Lingulodinium_polyedra.AAC.1